MTYNTIIRKVNLLREIMLSYAPPIYVLDSKGKILSKAFDPPYFDAINKYSYVRIPEGVGFLKQSLPESDDIPPYEIPYKRISLEEVDDFLNKNNRIDWDDRDHPFYKDLDTTLIHLNKLSNYILTQLYNNLLKRVKEEIPYELELGPALDKLNKLPKIIHPVSFACLSIRIFYMLRAHTRTKYLRSFNNYTSHYANFIY